MGSFPKYEDQLTTWNPHSDKPKERESPDRIDAGVHGITYLLGREKSTAQVVSPHAVGLESARRRSGVHPLERMRRKRTA